ncbi:hypothetical protein RHMOL_Rhmol01G0182500 [Rhododendron molle]|uniref:Uncharacterized protein n=1 Tax=Rhododendron molle TaxID=49168 RepID=A0ACC0Q2P7_RHOML|nr:hypothetical protein RHMOL_Rhmol01G0182500 [Rhododendron molle]
MPSYFCPGFSSPQSLPHLLLQYLHADGSTTWILLRHGSRVWPVEVINHRFGDGWDTFRSVHGLGVDYRIILAWEHKWIFHSIMFDRQDRELVFDWSGLNGYWQDIHPPSGYIFVTMLVNREVRIVMFDSIESNEIIYECLFGHRSYAGNQSIEVQSPFNVPLNLATRDEQPTKDPNSTTYNIEQERQSRQHITIRDLTRDSCRQKTEDQDYWKKLSLFKSKRLN